MKIHIHLDPDKPDEERALRILDDWQRRTGLPLQKILVMALLSLQMDPASIASEDESVLPDELRDLLLGVQDQSAATLNEVRQLVDQIQDLLEQGLPAQMNGQVGHEQPVDPEPAEPPREKLPDAMIASLKKGVKPGITLDD